MKKSASSDMKIKDIHTTVFISGLGDLTLWIFLPATLKGTAVSIEQIVKMLTLGFLCQFASSILINAILSTSKSSES